MATCRKASRLGALLMAFVLIWITYMYISSSTGSGIELTDWEDYPEYDFGEDVKPILLWNTLYGDKKFWLGELGQSTFINNNCNYRNCFVHRNKRMLANSTAVVFFMGTTSPNNIPKRTHPGQLFVQVLRESPAYHKIPIDDVINVTMTYRHDSDIFFPYFKLQSLPSTKSGPYVPRYNISARARSVVWLVSNCQTIIGREKYVKMLSKYIDVEIIGMCGNRSCPMDKMSECMEDIARTYKFYLSFENSFCVDYVTEKPERPSHYDLVPVVLGGANYTRDLPPRSYINVLDYQSPRDLANYLTYLSQNVSAYLEYFQWHQKYAIKYVPTADTFCDLCRILNNSTYHKTYKNFSSWWSVDKCENDPLKDVLLM